MNENGIGTIVIDCAVELHRDLVIVELKLTGLKLGYLLIGEASMREGITRIIHGNLDPDPPCLSASVTEPFIEPAASTFNVPGKHP